MLKKVNLSWAVLAMLTLCGGLRADGEKPAPASGAADLKATIKSGVEMLKSGKSDEFLERFIMPADMEKLKQSGHLDDAKKGFKEKSVVLAKVFEAIKDVEPKFSDDGTTASYEIPKIEFNPPSEGSHFNKGTKFHFKKIKDKWYIGEY